MLGEMLGRITFFILLPLIVMAVLGGMRYLAARPRLSFRRAMFQWWVVLIGVGVLVLGLIGQVARSL
jgi:hypothetical protein